MKWWPESCESGDMIRVKVGSIWHYGIFVSEDEVIEFGPPPVSISASGNKENRVMSASIDEFSAGGIVERAVLSRDEHRKRIPPKKTVAIARSRIGEGGYDLIHNNCEHFAYKCVFGIDLSTQTQSVREKWLNRPIFDVYYMNIPEDTEIREVYPQLREEYIKKTTNDAAKLQRYSVWFLLEKAITRSFNMKMDEISFSENKGKWSCDKLQFSLSHTKGAVAVAVSNGSCGVDIENLEDFISRHSDADYFKKLAKRICTLKELPLILSPEDLISFWTKKEAIFKCYGSGSFFSRKVDSFAHENETKLLGSSKQFVLSACGEKLEKMRVFVYENNEIRQINFNT